MKLPKKVLSIFFSTVFLFSSIPAYSYDAQYLAPPAGSAGIPKMLLDPSRTAELIIRGLTDSDPLVRQDVAKFLAKGEITFLEHLSDRDIERISKKVFTYYASLPVSGKAIFYVAKNIGKPVITCNIDNGELSALQIRAFMLKAIEYNAFAMFEVGPDALLTYADGKPHLPQYCAMEAQKIFKETGKIVVYAVHFHNQLDVDLYLRDRHLPVQKNAAVKEAIARNKSFIEQGGTSIETDTSNIKDPHNPDLKDVTLKEVIETTAEIIIAAELHALKLGVVVGYEGSIERIEKTLSNYVTAGAYCWDVTKIVNKKLKTILGPHYNFMFDVLACNSGANDDLQFFKTADKIKPYPQAIEPVEKAIEQATKIFNVLQHDFIAVAFRDFSGIPLKIAKKTINTGIAKVNINIAWQGIIWKVLKAYYPDLYTKLYNRSHAALKKKGSDLAQHSANEDRKTGENKIIFGQARKLFRRPKGTTDPDFEGWKLIEEITDTLKNGGEKMRIVQSDTKQARQDLLFNTLPAVSDRKGITALEAIRQETTQRYGELLTALKLKNSARAINDHYTMETRTAECRLQPWQLEELKKLLEKNDSGPEKDEQRSLRLVNIMYGLPERSTRRSL